MTALAPIAGKLGSLLRMLTSDKDGEVLGHARALVRVLATNGADMHDLAAHVEGGNGKLTDAEMKKLYDAGYRDGTRAAEDRHYGAGNFRNADGTPEWHEMASWCQRRGDRLRDKEREFVDDMAGRTVWREPTEKQAKWLKSIWFRLGGGRGA
jgi:hypothetical protein